MMDAPQVGDIYRCKTCEFEIQVTKGCDCKDCTAHLECCGQPMDKTPPMPIQNA